MHKCTYHIYIRNNARTIPKIIDSLSEIKGNIWKEFLIINDGSTDNSLEVLKKSIAHFPRVTILSQKYVGLTQTINKILTLAHGDYIQFVDGFEIPHQLSTMKLIGACEKHQTEVAFGFNNNGPNGSFKLTSVIDGILGKRLIAIDTIGQAGTMIKKTILAKINTISQIKSGNEFQDKAALAVHDLREHSLDCANSLGSFSNGKWYQRDEPEVYLNSLALSLECAKYTDFSFVNDRLSEQIETKPEEASHKIYNNLSAIHNFAIENPGLAKENILGLIIALYIQKKALSNMSFKDLVRQLIFKNFQILSLDQVLDLYKCELQKLF